ncbi:hypothetical protein EDEG_01772 [Edhazardia aedis USNM 41457]|uniref:Uncharacterized protein n=1 Tax=Edhazardia aedis (strain USNM 41457) TaxID=1003232 RepID=J9D8V1_EDHAE|nr:hypothetical protein EDEG_01772 [Edhazardia aedis USNM 41457]|eukprot:EJW03934.1 hypothetical protein EDEG_01772 [Edhazardia aedis USNM 41457]
MLWHNWLIFFTYESTHCSDQNEKTNRREILRERRASKDEQSTGRKLLLFVLRPFIKKKNVHLYDNYEDGTGFSGNLSKKFTSVNSLNRPNAIRNQRPFSCVETIERENISNAEKGEIQTNIPESAEKLHIDVHSRNLPVYKGIKSQDKRYSLDSNNSILVVNTSELEYLPFNDVKDQQNSNKIGKIHDSCIDIVPIYSRPSDNLQNCNNYKPRIRSRNLSDFDSLLVKEDDRYNKPEDNIERRFCYEQNLQSLEHSEKQKIHNSNPNPMSNPTILEDQFRKAMRTETDFTTTPSLNSRNAHVRSFVYLDSNQEITYKEYQASRRASSFESYNTNSFSRNERIIECLKTVNNYFSFKTKTSASHCSKDLNDDEKRSIISNPKNTQDRAINNPIRICQDGQNMTFRNQVHEFHKIFYDQSPSNNSLQNNKSDRLCKTTNHLPQLENRTQFHHKVNGKAKVSSTKTACVATDAKTTVDTKTIVEARNFLYGAVRKKNSPFKDTNQTPPSIRKHESSSSNSRKILINIWMNHTKKKAVEATI